jgi:hypothetical protein
MASRGEGRAQGQSRRLPAPEADRAAGIGQRCALFGVRWAEETFLTLAVADGINPAVENVKSVRGQVPAMFMVYIPEYVVSRWYEQLLQKQAALRLKSHLLFTSGVMVKSVPWQMHFLQGLKERPGDAGERFAAQGPDQGRELVGAGCEGRVR